MHPLVRGLLAAALTAAVAAPSAAEAAPVQVSQSGWAWGNPTPQGNSIRAMDFDGGRGYAIGDAGTALRTDDGGATWKGLPTGTTAPLTRLQVVTPDVITALGGNGCVLRRSTNGGQSFSRVYALSESDCPNPVAVTYFDSPDVGYLVLKDGSVLRTTDGGDSFSKQTALPGTAASTGGGNDRPFDVTFTAADTGFALTSSGGFRTTDSGVSWTPVSVGPATHVQFVSDTVAYAFGIGGLSRSDDGGATWANVSSSVGQTIATLSCSSPDVCIAVPETGATLLRTEDGGATFSSITPASRAIYAVAWASDNRVVAAGDGGVTVTSDDGGKNFSPVGGDIGGAFLALRPGTVPGTAFALGVRGSLGRTIDSGATWSQLSVPTSANLSGVSFATPTAGYAIDAAGGLFKTANGGSSWQTLDPGTNGNELYDVATLGESTVLLLTETGVRRQQETGGRFDVVPSKAVKGKGLTSLNAIGTRAVAWGAKAIALSATGGGSWTAVPIPNPTKAKKNRLRLSSVDFTTVRRGYAVDTRGRLFRTTNTGKTWSEVASTGAPILSGISFSDDQNGFATASYEADPDAVYVLRTSDGGRTWRPQRLAVGRQTLGGVLATSEEQAYALVSPDGRDTNRRQLFATGTGGDAGSPSALRLKAKTKSLTKKQLKRLGWHVTVTGTLDGAQGGERIVVSARSADGTVDEQVVTAGANGGSFTARFAIEGTTAFVAQWAGDSGRQGVGTTALTVKVK